MALTHVDEQNRPNMVNVGEKEATTRTATASGVITMSPKSYDAVINQTTKKGAVLHTAVIASIMGAKKTPELIPMCHPLLLTSIKCDIEEMPKNHAFKLFVTCKLNGQTGVEMEALTGVSVGLLTIYDMVKAIDKGMVIENIQLESKTGGKSGEFRR